MDSYSGTIIPTINITWFLLSLGSLFLIIYNWRRRWLYYYTWNIPGPFSLPLLGTVSLLVGKNDFNQKFIEIAKSQPQVFKMFVGPNLWIVTLRPEDLEIILHSCLHKSQFYEFVTEHSKNTLFSAPFSVWKQRRSVINHSFSPRVLNTFQESFAKYAKAISHDLGKLCGKEQSDLLSIIWRGTLDNLYETILDVNPVMSSERYEVISFAERIEKTGIKRIQKFYLYLNFIWRMSPWGKEFKIHTEGFQAFMRKLADLKMTLLKGLHKSKDVSEIESNMEQLGKKRFLNLLTELTNNKQLSREALIDEVCLMTLAGSETTAFTINFLVLLLGLYPKVQENIYQELNLVLKDNNKDITFEDIKQLHYVERVIKETMRLFPAVPLIQRYLSQDVQLDGYVFPAGSDVLVSIEHIHRRPELWPDPLEFNPDRFLPEEVQKRPRCAFIPFSVGQRNCIGFQYGMLFMKCIVAEIIKHYTIRAINYNSVEEIETEFHILLKPKQCYNVIFERRI